MTLMKHCILWVFLLAGVWPGLVFLFSSCTGISNNLPSPPVDASLVARYGWGGQSVIRWDRAVIDVYDTTGYSRLPEVIERWNQVHGDWQLFRLTANPESPLVVKYEPELDRYRYCGLAAVWRDARNRIVRSEIRINPSPDCQDQFLIFLHEFGHAAGFRGHTEEGGVMDAPVAADVITDTLVRFFQSLGRLSPGEVLPVSPMVSPVSIDGRWQGYMASEAMPVTGILFDLERTGYRVEGSYETENGRTGLVTGELSGEVLLFELHPADPAYPEPLIGLANFFEGVMLFSFSGRDGQGDHPDGLGRAERMRP